MEQPNYLIDTNAVIDYLGGKLSAGGMAFMDAIMNEIPNVSVITKIEVLGFNASKEHYTILSNFISDAIVFDLTDEVVNVCIALRKVYRAKLPDAIIAATALVNDFTLITRNVSDFKNIQGLRIYNTNEN